MRPPLWLEEVGEEFEDRVIPSILFFPQQGQRLLPRSNFVGVNASLPPKVHLIFEGEKVYFALGTIGFVTPPHS